MKYIIIVAFLFVLAGCSTTREIPDDRYQPVYPAYGYYNSDPYYTPYAPAYDYTYRDRIYYDNNYYGRRPRYNSYPQYRGRVNQPYNQAQQPQYRAVQQPAQTQIIQPRVVQPRDIKYPDGTIKRADGQIIHPGQRERK